MKRKFLFALYQTPRGKLLATMEGQYLRRSITVSCKQQQLQIGGLGFEDSFIDCSLYKNYCILDNEALGTERALRIRGKAFALPIQTESMDLVILPHMLEFDEHRFRTMREIDRVLKPGGELIILTFNPFSYSVLYQYLWERKLSDSWRSHFLGRSRIQDWLQLMNFEVLSTVDFYVDSFTVRSGKTRGSLRSLLSMAYGVKAVKRRYKLVPVGQVNPVRRRLVSAGDCLRNSLT